MNNKLAFVYPPNKQQSLKHRQANRIFRKIDLKQINQERCECCGKYVGQESEADCICYDPYFEMQFLGAGVPLLFAFMRNMTILLLVFISIVALHATLSNILDNSCSVGSLGCQSDVISRLSVSNKLLDVDSIQVQIYLTMLMTGVWTIFNQYIIYRLRKTEFQTDYYIQTPSDYAILISGLPESATQSNIRTIVKSRNKELKEDEQKLTSNLKIKNILLPKKLDEYHQEQLKQQSLFMQAIKNNNHEQFEKAEIAHSKDIAKVALVIFEQQKSKEFFLQKKTLSTQIKSLFCSWGVALSQFKVKDENLIILRAPQPDDIIWKNLGRSPKSILINKIITYLSGAVLLFANGVIQYLLAVWQAKQPPNSQQAISLFSSIIVTIVNYLITVFLIWTTEKEGNLTSTIECQSLTIKIVYFQFINSGIFYTFSNALAVDFDTDMLEEIFSDKVTVFMAINAFSQPVITFIVDYFQLDTIFQRCMFERDIMHFTQKQCNEIYQLPGCQIPFKYAYIVRTLLLTFFFTPFVPIVAFFSLTGLLLYYYVCKILFRYSYRLPNVRSNEINTTSLLLSYSFPLALNLGQFLIYLFINSSVDVDLSSSITFIVYFSLSLSILWTILPWYEINAHFFSFQQSTNENYNDNAFKFEVTYEMIDPFYDGEKSLQRDSHFLRRQSQQTGPLPLLYSIPKLKSANEILPCIATDPQLPASDRKFLSTQ